MVDDADAPALSVRVLGPLRARVGEREPDLGPPLQRALFAVLAVRANQVVSGSELIDAVWGEQLPGSPRGALYTYVAGLRRALEPGRAHRAPGRFLESSSSGYRLNTGADGTDLIRFEQHRDRGRRAWKRGALAEADAAFADALALFEGAALGAVPGPFAQIHRAALAEQRLAVLEDHAEVRLAQGRDGEVIGLLRPLTLEEPLRERPWAHLMLALYRVGRQGEALSAFDEARAAAVEQLGLGPGPLLTDLRQRIVVGDPALIPTAAGVRPKGIRILPRGADHFTGRAREIDRLLSLAAAQPLPVCCIDGMAGVGKTALALQVAHLLAGRYPDAQLYLDLQGYTPGQAPMSAAAALDKLLHALGVPGRDIPVQADERAALWRTRLAGLRAVIVLDNAADAAQIRLLLPGSAGPLVLITSRRRLSDLDAGEFLSLEVLAAAEAATLFATAAGARRVAAEPAAAAAVAHACGYLPLAIRIAAARLRHRPAWTVTHLVDRLGDEERRLGELRAGEHSVAAAFTLSYRGLDPRLQRLLRLLGLFPGPRFDAGAAAALAGTDLVRADRALQELVDAHLLDEPSPDHYRLHDLIGAFAKRQCREQDPPDARHAALRRLFDFYLRTVDNAEELLRPRRLDRAEAAETGSDTTAHRFPDRERALAWLDGERGNLVPVVRAAAQHGFHRHAWQIARYLWGFFETRRHWADWADCYEVALDSARRDGDRLAEARILVGLGVISNDMRRYEDAVDRYHAALALMRETGFRSGEAGALTNLGNTYRRMGRLAECIACQEEALRICWETQDRTGEAIALANLGELYREDGRNARSVEVQQQALVMFRAFGDRRVEGSVLDGLARTFLAMGEHERALAHGRQALERRRECGDRLGETETLDCLGRIHRSTGHLAEAERAWRAALAIADELGAPIAADLRARLAARHDDPPCAAGQPSR